MADKKSVLVTGASSGIGYATAIEFAKRGYQVFAAARRLEPMEPLAENYGVTILRLDVSSLESVKHAKEFISERTGGKLDYLYNNAGQSCTFPAIDVTDEWFEQCFQVNVFGPIRVVREFTDLLIKSKGTVGFTGSVSGIIPFPFSCIYSSSKAAIHQYAATLRIEMKPFDVKVINFITGGVKTDIEDKRGLPPSSKFNVKGIDEALVERRQMASRNNPISAEDYAKQVVGDFEKLTLEGPLNIYRGKMALFLSYLLYWCPRFIVERILLRKFKLEGVYLEVNKKYGKSHIE